MESVVGTIVIIVAVGLIVFFLMREVISWYFKIDTILANQKTQIEKQDEIISLLRKMVKSDNDMEVFPSGSKGV